MHIQQARKRTRAALKPSYRDSVRNTRALESRQYMRMRNSTLRTHENAMTYGKNEVDGEGYN